VEDMQNFSQGELLSELLCDLRERLIATSIFA